MFVTIPQDKLVGRLVGLTDNTVYRCRTTVGKNAVARMRMFWMRYYLWLLWNMKLRKRFFDSPFGDRQFLWRVWTVVDNLLPNYVMRDRSWRKWELHSHLSDQCN